ncbi:MAG: hypothetical protein ACJ74H_22105 [Thermoanaerobaculia bacterium]
MRYERFWIYTIFLMAIACSRETPVPSETTTAATVAPTATAAKPVTAGSYDEAMVWFRSAPAFRFTVDEAGVHAEGELSRKTIGSESIHFRANGEEWRATAGPKGVAWERGGKAANAPTYGNRLYQRLTLAFDPQKKEGAAQLVEPGHYRFTNANTGEVHDVWVTADNRLQRMKIGDSFELKIEN